MRQLTCPGCGGPFGCGLDSGSCWCADVSLDTPAREQLGAAHADCFCRACLEAAASGPEKPTDCG